MTQTEHALQAAKLAFSAGAPEYFIVGMLLHDVGQIIEDDLIGDEKTLHKFHDEYGGDWLREVGFPSTVSDIARFHTIAKLLLCEDDPEYYESMSTASQQSYLIQKEKYGDAGIRFIREHPHVDTFIAARKCDDMAKIPGKIDETFEMYRPMVERVLRGKGKSASNPDWRKEVDRMYDVNVRKR